MLRSGNHWLSRMCMQWLYVADLIIAEADKLSTPSVQGTPIAAIESATAGLSHSHLFPIHDRPPHKMPNLLQRYARSSTSAYTSSAKQPLSTLAEYQKYLAMCQCGDDIHDCLLFWIKNITELPTIFELAMKVQSVPATSAPVERIFSDGGIIMMPNRARLNDTMLSNIVFLKCDADNMDMKSSTDLNVIIV